MIGRIIHPTLVSVEMMEFARPSNDNTWIWASNLTAMLRLGYCRKCGMVPEGCRREGCRANSEIHDSATSDDAAQALAGNQKPSELIKPEETE